MTKTVMKMKTRQCVWRCNGLNSWCSERE